VGANAGGSRQAWWRANFLTILAVFAYFFTLTICARITYTLATKVGVGPTMPDCRKCRLNFDLGQA
jgi:hypothetical protein